MLQTSSRFAVCLDNQGYPASLEVGEVYQVIQNLEAKKHGLIRVVDESGEDYAFAIARFKVNDGHT